MQWSQQPSSKQASPNKQKTSIQRIQQTKAALDETIEDLNNKLHQHFHNKEQALIQQYKQELIEAQKELNTLKSTTNEEQIKGKMLERKKDLERERHQLIQTNIFFSSKCEEYKRKLSELIAEGKELERELVFLDSQLNSTSKRKYQVLNSHDQQEFALPAAGNLAKQEESGSLPLFSERKQEISKKLTNSISVRSTNKKVLIEQAMISRHKKNMIRGELPKLVLEKTPLEELFEITVAEIKEKRKGKRVSLKGEQFSDYEKKLIMEEFLSKEEVKKKIYQIIFENQDKKTISSSFQPEPKVKISYDDIN